METPAEQYYEIEIGGKRRKLYYEWADWATAESLLDIDLVGPRRAEFWSKPAGHVLAVALFVGLLREWPGLTLQDTRRLITWQNCAEIETVVMEALSAVFSPAKTSTDAPEEGDPLAGASGGTASGQ